MLRFERMKNGNIGQSAAEPRIEEGSTTIPEGSRDIIPKQVVYLKVRNVIYSITNTLNNKRYIGSASYFDKRMGTHVSKLNRNIHWNIYLQSAWNKYTKDNFKLEIIERVEDQSKLVEREQFYIDYFESCDRTKGYNLSCVANSCLGVKRSEAFKKAVGDYWRGKSKSPEEVVARKIARTELQGIKVSVYHKDGTFHKYFDSLAEAARQCGVTTGAVRKQCDKPWPKKPRNYIFRYKDMV